MKIFIIAIICILSPFRSLAQAIGSELPSESALMWTHQKPESWRVSNYQSRNTLRQRAFIGVATTVEQSYLANDLIDGEGWGARSRIAGGVWITPFQGIEIGLNYGFTPTIEWHTNRLAERYYRGEATLSYGIDINYIFSITSFAKRLEYPSKWELIAKGGIDIREQIGVNFSLKVQYNFTSISGVYIEPRYGLYTPSLADRGDNLYIGNTTSAFSVGLTLRLNAPTTLMNNCSADEHPIIAFSTNLAYWAFMIPNVGLEFPINNHLSLAFESTFAPFKNRGAQYSYQIFSADSELKYWLGKQPLRGHFIGVYGGYGKYDLDIMARGNQGSFFYTGMSYGYVKGINNVMALEFSASWGYTNSTVKKYESEGECLVYKSSHQFTYDGINKITIGVIWSMFKNTTN